MWYVLQSRLSTQSGVLHYYATRQVLPPIKNKSGLREGGEYERSGLEGGNRGGEYQKRLLEGCGHFQMRLKPGARKLPGIYKDGPS